MGFYLEIEHDPNLLRTGSLATRDAVRAIIQNGKKILMIYSPINGEYKFPGGGIKAGETCIQALTREVREESGYVNIQVIRQVGEILEYRRPRETEIDLFCMRSKYYLCKLSPDSIQQPLDLDPYEQDLVFQPTWVDYRTALAANLSILQRNPEHIPRWTRRDTTVLERFLPELLPEIT